MFSVTNNLLFFSLKPKLVITYVFVAKRGSLCNAKAAYKVILSCVYYNNQVSCPSSERKPKHTTRVGNLLLAGCQIGLSNTQPRVISSMLNK